MLYLQYKTHFTTYSGILNCCLQLQETLPKLKTFSSVTTTPLSKIDVCVTVHRKICLPVASRLPIKLLNYPFLANVKCCSCVFYKLSPLSDNNNNNNNNNNNKMHNYNSYV
jgi:hypothetical protein